MILKFKASRFSNIWEGRCSEVVICTNPVNHILKLCKMSNRVKVHYGYFFTYIRQHGSRCKPAIDHSPSGDQLQYRHRTQSRWTEVDTVAAIVSDSPLIDKVSSRDIQYLDTIRSSGSCKLRRRTWSTRTNSITKWWDFEQAYTAKSFNTSVVVVENKTDSPCREAHSRNSWIQKF